jgi:hypothetical protein
MLKVSPVVLPLKTSVSKPRPPSTTSLPSPGFQMNVSLPAPRNAVSVPIPPTTVSSLLPPLRVSLPAPPMRVSLPLPPNSCAGGSTALPSEIVSSPFPPDTTILVVLATVGCPLSMDTAPLFTKICPAALLLVVMVLPRLSPVSASTPVAGLKLAVIAMVVVLSEGLAAAQCALAVNRVEWGALARNRMLSLRSDDRLEAELQTVLNFS